MEKRGYQLPINIDDEITRTTNLVPRVQLVVTLSKSFKGESSLI